jgi:hypothetical protein
LKTLDVEEVITQRHSCIWNIKEWLLILVTHIIILQIYALKDAPLVVKHFKNTNARRDH